MFRIPAAAEAARASRLLAATTVLLAAAALPAQPVANPTSAASGWRWEAGAALTRRIFRDVGRVDLTAGAAPSVGVARVWHRASGTSLSLGVRASRAGLAVEYPVSDDPSPARRDEPYSVGTLWQGDAIASAERPFGRRVALQVGAGGVVRRGPADVLPFKLAGATTISPALELGASLRLSPARPLFAAATVQAYRASGAEADPAGGGGESGSVQRLILVLRYGR
jgi:hypothetical protein